MNTSTMIAIGVASWICLIAFIYFISIWFYLPGVLAVVVTLWMAGCFWMLDEYEIAPFEEQLE